MKSYLWAAFILWTDLSFTGLSAQVHGESHGLLPSSERQLFEGSPAQKAWLSPSLLELNLDAHGTDAKSRAFFNQGMMLLYGSLPQEAERSFLSAHALSPEARLPVWGIAMSHLVRNSKNAIKWLEQIERSETAKTAPLQASALEDLFLSLLPESESMEEGDGAWRRTMYRELSEAILQKPDQIELKALQAWLLADPWYPYLKELDSSREDVQSLIEAVEQRQPRHPAHRLRLLLWSKERRHDPYRSKEQYFDLESLRLSPLLALHWNLAGQYLAEREEFPYANKYGEAAMRIHHRWIQELHVLPDQIPNYARHRAIQSRQLLAAGDAEASLGLAYELLRLPRHPVWNPQEKGYGSAYQGRKLLLDGYRFFGLWDELALALVDGRIPPLKAPRDQAEHAFSQAIAAWFRDDRETFGTARQNLKIHAAETVKLFEGEQARIQSETEEAPTIVDPHQGGIDQWLVTGGEDYLAVRDWEQTLDALKNSQDRAMGDAGKSISGCLRVPHLLRSRLLWRLGELELARQALLNTRELPIEVRTQALEASKQIASSERFPLQPDPKFSDSPGTREPVALGTLNLSSWDPPALPAISIPMLDGSTLSNATLMGKHSILIFFYDGGCLHCVEQLKLLPGARQAFADADLQVFAIGNQAPAALSSFLQDQDPLPARFGTDPDGQSFRALGAYDDFKDSVLHGVFYVDPKGRVLWRDSGVAPFMELDFMIEETRRLRTVYPVD
ncbi:MAG: peroxiredoxin family protein [Verrucomicrobiales bacterium]